MFKIKLIVNIKTKQTHHFAANQFSTLSLRMSSLLIFGPFQPFQISFRFEGMFFKFCRSTQILPLLLPTPSYFIFLSSFLFFGFGTYVAFFHISLSANLDLLITISVCGPNYSIIILPSSYKILGPVISTLYVRINILLSSRAVKQTKTLINLSISIPLTFQFM